MTLTRKAFRPGRSADQFAPFDFAFSGSNEELARELFPTLRTALLFCNRDMDQVRAAAQHLSKEDLLNGLLVEMASTAERLVVMAALVETGRERLLAALSKAEG